MGGSPASSIPYQKTLWGIKKLYRLNCMGILFKNMYFKRVTYTRHQSGGHGGHEKKRNSPFSQPIPAPPEVQSPPGTPPFPQKSLSPLIPNKSRPSPEKPGKFHMGRPRPLPFSTAYIPGMGKEQARYGKKRRPFQKRAPLIAGS